MVSDGIINSILSISTLIGRILVTWAYRFAVREVDLDRNYSYHVSISI